MVGTEVAVLYLAGQCVVVQWWGQKKLCCGRTRSCSSVVGTEVAVLW